MTRTTPPTLADLDWPVRTQRLVLRPATVGDADAVLAVRAQPEVHRWLTVAHRDAAAFHEEWPGRLAATLVMEHEGRLVGDLMVRIEDAWAQAEVVEHARGVQAELGWVLDPAYAGRGLATEAVAALLPLCFERLGLRRVTALCFADNEPSWRLMERLGMRRESHNIAESLHRDLGWLDGYGYALLAEEWRARRDAAAQPT